MVPTWREGASESLLKRVANAAFLAGSVKQDALLVVPFTPGVAAITCPWRFTSIRTTTIPDSLQS